jgi:short-subunit dehydrogenase
MHIVITGGSDGIGKALVEAYLLKGHYVSSCARNISKLQSAITHERFSAFQADVSEAIECEQFIYQAIAKHGPIDILINNAGISMRALFSDVKIEVIDQVMKINFGGAVYITKYALPSILNQKGVICNISSIAGFRGLPARTGYSASKFALQGFSEALRTELLKTGVHVMWVSPGFTSSNIRNQALSQDGSAQKETPLDESKLMSAEECAQRIISGIERRKRTLVMTTQGKLTVWINKLFPSLADKLVYNHFKKEADSPLR